MLINKMPAECMREHDGSDHCTINNLIDDAGYDGSDHYITHGLLPGAVNQARTVRQRKKEKRAVGQKTLANLRPTKFNVLTLSGPTDFSCDLFKTA